MIHASGDMPPRCVCGSESGGRCDTRAPGIPWFAEPVDEEARFDATGWEVGADEEFAEPDTYERDELVALGLLPPEPEKPRYVPPAGPTVTALVAGALGPLVARHRRLNRWTQTTFGRRIGVDQPRVSKIEHGRVSSLTLARLAELALETGSVVVLEIAPGTVADLPPDRRAAGGTNAVADLPGGGKARLMTVPAPVPAAAPASGRPQGAVGPVAWAIP